MIKTYIKSNMNKTCQLFIRPVQENCLFRLQSEFKASPGNLVRSCLKIDGKKRAAGVLSGRVCAEHLQGPGSVPSLGM